MVRDFVINGETLVSVQGGAHMSGGSIASLSELGLALDEVRVSPTYFYKPIMVNDFGDQCPANVMTNMAHADIRMNLVHFDVEVLEICLYESMGPDGTNFTATGAAEFGRVAHAGTLLGNGREVRTSGNRLIELTLASPQLDRPWTFNACYVVSEPLTYPLGTKRSVVDLTWRAIPYAPMVSGEIRSSGAFLYNRTQ